MLGLPDPLLRRRARHVVTECDRVRWCAAALGSGDLVDAGRLMSASHASLAEDFDASTPALDALVHHLQAMPGVYGARMTGAGFGGCVVVLSEPGAVDLAKLSTPAWRVRASAGRPRRDPLTVDVAAVPVQRRRPYRAVRAAPPSWPRTRPRSRCRAGGARPVA